MSPRDCTVSTTHVFSQKAPDNISLSYNKNIQLLKVYRKWVELRRLKSASLGFMFGKQFNIMGNNFSSIRISDSSVNG